MKRSAKVAVAWLIVAVPAALCARAASTGTCVVRTVAGSPTTDAGDGGQALAAQLFRPQGLARDSDGNIYIADSGNHRIRKISLSGVISTIAGTGVAGDDGDNGPATAARFFNASSLALDGQGNLYVADLYANRIRKIDKNGVITAFAGTGKHGFSGDSGPAISATFDVPAGIGADAQGNVFVTDISNKRIRRIGTDGTITTFAGNGLSASLATEGQKATDLAFGSTGYLTVDAQGNVYVPGGIPGVIKIGPDGIVHIVAGAIGVPLPSDGASALSVALYTSYIAIDSNGVVYVVAPDNLQNRILWRITPDHILHRITGLNVNGLLASPDGTVYIATDGDVVGIVSLTGAFTAFAGKSTLGYTEDGQDALLALLAAPSGLALDTKGNLFIVDGNRIRKLSADGTIQIYAGSLNGGSTGDGGPAIDAQLPFGPEIALDPQGNLFISDSYNCKVRKVDQSGTITTFAGTGGQQSNFPPSSPAASTAVCPAGIAADPQGNVYVGDPIAGNILKITSDGKMSLFLPGPFPGEPFERTSVSHLAVDAAGNLYYPSRSGIVRISPSATLAVVPGSFLAFPSPVNHTFAVDAAGTVFVSEYTGYADSHLRKIDASGNVSSIANGTLPNISANDGPAFYNSVGAVSGMTIDKLGNLYFSDASRARVRMVAPCTAAVYPFFSDTVVHGASYQRTYVSPGQVLSIFGSGLGPQQPVAGKVGSNGSYSTNLAGVKVFIGDLLAPLLYVSANQINAVAPFELPAGNSLSIQITYNDAPSELVGASTSASAPGMFTASQNGQGQAAALNQDGSVNSSTNPAHPGTVVRLFFTGAGQTTPAGVDGALTGSVPPTPVLATTARIGGQTADVVSAAGLEGAVQGVLQVKLRIPAGVTPGDAVPVELTVGTAISSSLATLAIR